MKYVVSAGGIVVRNIDNVTEICLIEFYLDKSKYTFPKGHIEGNEELEETAMREVKEEVGLENLQITKYLGNIIRNATEKTGEVVEKEIKIFLMTSNNFVHIKTEEDYEYKWVEFNEAVLNMRYEVERDFLIKHKEEILSI